MKDGLLDQVAALRNQQAEILKLIQAVARVVGVAEVQAELAAGQRAEMENGVSQAVQEGKIRKVGEVSPTSMVVGVEQKPDGGTVHPGRFQLTLATLPEETQQLFLGAKVPSHFTLPNGNVIQIVEAYEAGPAPEEKPAKVRKTKPKKAQAVSDAPTDAKN